MCGCVHGSVRASGVFVLCVCFRRVGDVIICAYGDVDGFCLSCLIVLGS